MEIWCFEQQELEPEGQEVSMTVNGAWVEELEQRGNCCECWNFKQSNIIEVLDLEQLKFSGNTVITDEFKMGESNLCIV